MIHMKMILFDFGGVIAHSDKEMIIQFFEKKLPLQNEKARSLFLEYKLSKKMGASEEEFWGRFEKRAQKKLPPDWESAFKQVYEESIMIHPGIFEFIEELKMKGFKVGILSNIDSHKASILRNLGLYDAFDPVVLSCDIGVRKPDEKAFQAFLEKANLLPEECIFIDDKERNVAAARKIGMKAVVFTSLAQLKAELNEKGYSF